MAGWNAEKVEIFKDEFLEFTKHVRINSKEKGQIVLGDHLYRAQHRFFDSVFDGLSRDIHDIKHLKSRQLGISTGSRALTLFWCGVHSGLKGYMVFDTDAHKEEARLELITMINSLPPEMDFPRIRRGNRYMLELENETVINFAAAGVSTKKSTGTLGRSSGINFVHASEMCSWADIEAIEAFRASLAKDFENRLYVWESTARGFNLWHDIWTEAKDDEDHQITLFSGWWAKDNQVILKSHPDFERYGLQPPTEKEIEKINQVREQYDWQITPEQLAWIRREMAPGAKQEGDAPIDYSGETIRLQENPWTEEDAFQMTGSIFFSPEKLTEQFNANVDNKYQTFMFSTGIEFTDVRVYKPPNNRSIELKVWEEPQQDCTYVVAADPAFGANENNDRSAIQVLRCYADGCDQIAEYAWPLIGTRPLAWVIMALCGWYAKEPGSDVYLIVELNGPGGAVWDEIVSTRQHINSGYQPQEMADKGLQNVFFNVKNYLYTRPDSMTSGKTLQWKTTNSPGPSGKLRIWERLRDFVENGMLKVRSSATLEEMRSVTRDGDSIAAQGTKKDDRVMSLSLGIRCWEERVRRTMSLNQRTREREQARLRLTPEDKYKMFTSYQFQSFLGEKKVIRQREIAALKASRRRFGR